MKVLYKLRFAPLLTAIAVYIVGFYYSMIKAGLPYQDPTPEMTKQYIADMNFGDALMSIGFVIFIASIIFLIVIKILKIKKTDYTAK